jgi:hypothetical protein
MRETATTRDAKKRTRYRKCPQKANRRRLIIRTMDLGEALVAFKIFWTNCTQVIPSRGVVETKALFA